MITSQMHLKLDFLFSALILQEKGKYLNRTGFFSKFAKHEIYIHLKGCYPQNSTHVNSTSYDMYL